LFGVGSPQARICVSHATGGKLALPVVFGTHAPPPGGAEPQRTLAGSYDNETNAVQFPCAMVNVPDAPAQVLSLYNCAAPT